MLERIHQSKVLDIMQRRKDGRPESFSLQFCKLQTGELVNYESCVLTSFHADGGTVNVLPQGYDSPRKIRRCLITRINGMKVYF